ncbi:hypothetical protein ACVIHC_002186 [Bradyrhizobium diazoefficiens]
MIPTDISNCIAWYDPQKYKTLATTPVTKTFDLTYVQSASGALRLCTSIPDQSGAGHTLTEFTSGNGVGHDCRWSNFRHCFYNAAASKAMVSTIFNQFSKNYTWSFTFQTGSTLGTDSLFGAQDASGRRMYVILTNTGGITFGYGGSTETVASLLTTNTYYHLIVSWSNTTGQITAYLNGTQITFVSPTYTLPTADCTIPLHFFARNNNGTVADFTNLIGVGDIIGYEKILTATERLQLQRYMERRWKKDLIFITIDSGGQSQEQGRTTVADWPNVPEYQGAAAQDAHDFRVLQYGRGGDDGVIILGCQSFDHWDITANNDVGPHLNASKTYLAYLDNPLYGDRIRLVIQPGAKGGSGIYNNGSQTVRSYWVAGDPIYDQFSIRSNAMKALLPHYQQALISWHQGYASASDGVTKAQHIAAQDALFTYFRSGVINGVGASTPIELGNLGGYFQAPGANQVNINAAINETPQRMSNTRVTDLSDLGPEAALSDGLHLDPPYARIFGNRKGASWIALAPQPMNSTYGLLVV